MAQLKQGFRRTKSIMLRLTPDEHKLIVRAAKSHRSLSDYVRSIAVKDAGKAMSAVRTG